MAVKKNTQSKIQLSFNRLSLETNEIFTLGVLSAYKSSLVQMYQKEKPERTEDQCIDLANETLNGPLGSLLIDFHIAQRIRELNVKEIVEEVSKTNGVSKQFFINLAAAAVGAFVGPFAMQLLKAMVSTLAS